MSFARHGLRCLLLPLFVAGMFIPAHADPDRKISIEVDQGVCYVDYLAVGLRYNKNHTVRWASASGSDTFDIEFDQKKTPCLGGTYSFTVQGNKDSDKCHVNPALKDMVFKYSINWQGKQCADPIVVVQDGNGDMDFEIKPHKKDEKGEK